MCECFSGPMRVHVTAPQKILQRDVMAEAHKEKIAIPALATAYTVKQAKIKDLKDLN